MQLNAIQRDIYSLTLKNEKNWKKLLSYNLNKIIYLKIKGRILKRY